MGKDNHFVGGFLIGRKIFNFLGHIINFLGCDHYLYHSSTRWLCLWRDERQEVCVTSSLLSLAPRLEGAQSKGPYLIFVISFTQTGYSKTKFLHPKKRLKAPKTLKMSLKKVKYMHFFTQSGKIDTWQKIFTQTCLWCLWQIWGMECSHTVVIL